MNCIIEGCEKRAIGRGWCHMHYKRWQIHGDPLREPETAEQRFWRQVDRSGACWLWCGYLDRRGYGVFGLDYRGHRAHRIAYEYVVGPIPEGLELDHLCRNPRCVNPAHLEPVTHAENKRRAKPWHPYSQLTHCKNGHEFTPENTYMRPDRPGSRGCRACNAAAQGRRKERNLP